MYFVFVRWSNLLYLSGDSCYSLKLSVVKLVIVVWSEMFHCCQGVKLDFVTGYEMRVLWFFIWGYDLLLTGGETPS